MWKRSENIVHRLFSRQISCGAPNTNTHSARVFYENVVPSHTVYEVDCPDQWWRRFTNDGQYLVCFSRSSQDLLLYRPMWLSYPSSSHSGREEDAADEQLPSRASKFESYFSLLHRVPLATAANEVICKDFFLATDNNRYGIFATSTAPDPNAPAAEGAVAGVPVMEKITFLIVRLEDGVITARSVFQDDYIHLAHNAGVFLYDELLAILSVRFQRIHIKQIRDGGLFLDIRTIGEFCREDDELLLNSQSQEEAHYQSQALHRQARGAGPSSSSLAPAPAVPPPLRGKDFWGNHKAFPSSSSRWPPPPAPPPPPPQDRTGDPGTSGDLDYSLYEGYFRDPPSSLPPAPGHLDNVRVCRFIEGRVHHGRHFRLGGGGGGDTSSSNSSSYEDNTTGVAFESFGPRVGEGYPESSSSRSSSSSDTRDALEPTVNQDEFGGAPPRTRPVPNMFSGGGRRAESSLSQEEPGGPSVSFPRGTAAAGGAAAAAGEDGDFVVTGRPSSGRGDAEGQVRLLLPTTTTAGQTMMLGGLKHRLLSFILQGIQDFDTIPAIKAQRLKRFYYHFQHYADLVMWKVQFLDRNHLLIKFGSADGLVSRIGEASNQTAFLAVYNMETTDMLGFYENSSEELLQCVERYCDYFTMASQYPLYMNFISSYSNNSFAREQLQKQKTASATGKAGPYSQVVRRTLASLPHNSQSQSPSPYFDQYLFQYDEKLISATDRHKPCMEHPIKFISRRRPNTLKFKINPGTELGSNDGHIKRVASFFFHPIYPFAISVQQSFMQTTIVNFHFRK